MNNIDQISGKKLKENLTNYREQAILSKKLATIIKDVPIEINLEDSHYEIPNTAELKAILEELEFNSIISRLDFDDSQQKSQAIEDDRKIVEIDSLDQLLDCINDALRQDRIALLFDSDIVTFAWDKNRYIALGYTKIW